MAASQDELVSTFCSVTGASTDEAIQHLTDSDWDGDLALARYFAAQEGDQESAANPASSSAGAPTSSTPAAAVAATPAYTGPRTLDGRPAPQSASASSSSAPRAKQPAKKKGLMTLSSLMGSGHGGHDHDDDDEEDEEDDNRGRGDLFAGGEKSGLAVQDPNMAGHPDAQQKMIRDIIAKAKAGRGSAEESEAGPSQPTSSRFHGSGQTLGGEGVPSRTIPDPSGRPSGSSSRGGSGHATPSGGNEEVQERVLHIWQDGFSIDDGELHRFDDPANAADLALIRQGRAPLHLMNVQLGQAVDVKLHQHQEEWHQLPRVYRPFGGEGRRLGSPVPGDSSVGAAAAAPATASPLSTTTTATASVTTSSGPVAPTIDESLPTLTIRVQLPDGTRLPARFNTTQTIGDVYEFVERALPASSRGRAWVIATTFPNKDHTDKSLVLSETAEFKRGGAAIVKWV